MKITEQDYVGDGDAGDDVHDDNGAKYFHNNITYRKKFGKHIQQTYVYGYHCSSEIKMYHYPMYLCTHALMTALSMQ